MYALLINHTDERRSKMTDTIQIYHNPRCSKSRQTLALIEEQNIQPEIILYLENTPTAETLSGLLKKLNISARELLRKGEQDYKDNKLNDTNLSEQDLIVKMTQFPKLIERPIVVKGDQAILGRPPENVKGLL